MAGRHSAQYNWYTVERYRIIPNRLHFPTGRSNKSAQCWGDYMQSWYQFWMFFNNYESLLVQERMWYVTNELGLYAWEDLVAPMAACGTVCVYLFGCQVSLGHPPSHQVSSLCCKADPWHDPSKSPESGLHALVLLVLSTIATSVSTNTAMPFGWFSTVLHFSGLITHLWTHILQHIPSLPYLELPRLC